MNNSFQRSNDMNSFRSSIAGSIARYDNNIAAGNARVLQARTNAQQQAKELKGTGDSLEKIGLEVTTATHAVTGTVKSIKNAYTKVVDAKNKVKDSVENIKDKRGCERVLYIGTTARTSAELCRSSRYKFWC